MAEVTPKQSALDQFLSPFQYSCKHYAAEMQVGRWELACILCRLVKKGTLDGRARRASLPAGASGKDALQAVAPELFGSVIGPAQAHMETGVRRKESGGPVCEFELCPVAQAAAMYWDTPADPWL